MSKFLGRIKNLLPGGSNKNQLPSGSFPNTIGNAATLGTIHKPPVQSDDEDEDEEEIGSMRNYNVPEQTRLKTQTRETPTSSSLNQSRHPYGNASTPPSTPLNAFTTPTRSTSDGFLPDISTNNKKTNNNMDSFSNRTTNPDTQSRSGLPFLSDIQNRSAQPPLRHIPTPTNNPTSLPGGPPNQSTQLPPPPPPPPAQNNASSSFGGFPSNPDPNSNQPPPNNPQSSFNGFPWNMNPNQPPAPNNPQSSFNGSPWNMNSNQPPPPPPNNSQYPPNDSSSGMNNNQPPMYKPSDFQSYQSDNSRRSRLELDYPIEDVLIDANIPQTMAVKINDVVEQDRLGNAYHIHRYTFQSANPQQIAFKNHNSHFGGSRYIREVNYPDSNTSYEQTKRPKPVSHPKQRTNKHFNRSYDHFIDELIRTPGSYVLQSQNPFDIQSILQQQQQFAPFSSTINSTPWTAPNSAAGPVFYYTAQALSHDPMRQF